MSALSVECATLDLSGRRVVVVEDEPLVALEIASELEDAGAQVLLAYDLDQAIRLFVSRPDLHAAVLDVDLKGREVFPAASILRDRGVPIVFHTGRGSTPALIDEYPRCVVLSKPSEPERIVRSVAQLVAA